MYNGLLHLHNLGRWIVLLLLIIVIFKSLAGMLSKSPFTAGDRKLGLFLMITAHIMLLIGLYQWFVRMGLPIIRANGMKEVMHNAVLRFWAVEHPVMMLIGIILITIGRGSAKKNISDIAKHRRSFLLYLLALIVIVAAVPWPFRELVARPLLPGMH